MAQKTKKSKKKEKIITPSGRVYITAGMNNTIITVTDSTGNTLFTASSGSAGFKGSRKSTPYASTKAAEVAGTAASKAGVRDVAIYLKGAGLGRISSIKALKTAGLNVVSISDLTPIPHNGCRPKKKRRI
ncbi:30S ribosomal protein S11 [candidate division WWE3 bacterium RIFOXYB1_FULL_43_24]|uniref:Small ribosomal subunit protein uS11 n=2 Tax=Katanobacteria TaxID=422282 RepID=A0A0G1AZK6_UNCKA|nr:MAG: 30S ribosomal protein S11 [candidate division WWE3 bacterium GW2011_GWA1_42_12]KKS39516.1 MAG: 30S ribosomal protein S11 [candidate division WWE3 bacterium GW2011_GWF1_42_14]KKS40959.1 MAG: 30S ribosomal protein S11 [candidate division WWE3 bacterium GW2011_GWE1_42_16]KKS66783.1 MAG: 30S ribosomal protein S11 [candidate division WWE3 bacterium GW2011_GWB1_42_6]KKS72865.1 MAG: 30S ribosomal protein S11 [candidate division WWE3 bacterium GW2011_GWD1_42_70]OGC58866.1 MAG: 30S ribosomal pr